jgi:hypothetical protein
MGNVSDLIGALALLGIMRAWDAREEARKSRQEEVFVPFNLPPLPQREQSIPHPAAETSPRVAVAASVPHVRSTP